MSDTRPVVLTAGGTGGHMFPAEALARALLARGVPVVLITDARGKAFGDALSDVRVERIRAAIPGGSPIAKVRGIVDLTLGAWQASRILKRVNPRCVVGFGGYASAPAVFAAQRMGLSTILHEQNAVLGRANRFVAKRAAVIATAFENVRSIPSGRTVVLTGNPVRPAIAALAERPYPPLSADGTLSILVTGGSQGAKVFSYILPEAVKLLPESLQSRLNIVQQARADDIEAARAAYAGTKARAELQTFFHDMPERLATCHLMICRSGASTVSEVAAAGRPAILVPYPHAMDDHQTVNARAVVDAGAGWLMPQDTFTSEAVAQKLQAFLTEPDTLVKAAHAAKASARLDAAERLADAVLAAAHSSTTQNTFPKAAA